MQSLSKQAAISRHLFLIIMTFVALAPQMQADEAAPQSWDSILPLLRDRQYSSASKLLEQRKGETVSTEELTQIQSDIRVLAGLDDLIETTAAALSTIEDGALITVDGRDFKFRGVQRTDEDTFLKLESKSSGVSYRRAFSGLPAATLLELSEWNPSADDTEPLIAAVLLSFDKIPDRKAGRRILNVAARNGDNIEIWLSRIARLEQKQSPTPDRKGVDPLIGKWYISPSQNTWLKFTIEFRKDGTNTAVLSAEAILHARRNKLTMPPNPSIGKWERNDNGTYSATFFSGGGAMVIDQVAGDLLTATNLKGEKASGVRVR